jgi:hypothetical protein
MMSVGDVKWKRVFWKHERKIIAAFAEAILGWPGGMGTPRMEEMLESAEKQVWCMPVDKRLLFRACLWVFELSAIFYYVSFRVMSRMNYDLRTRYLSAWHNTWWSIKRVIKRFVEVVIIMNYYSLAEVSDSIGYKPKYKPPFPSPEFPTENLIKEFPTGDVNESVDVCVIGSGAGGAVVAKELAEKGHSVVLLEEGLWLDVDDLAGDTMTITRKAYRDGGAVAAMGWPFIPLFLGRCVGGTTLINSGTCFRTPADVLKRWVDEFGLSGWSADHLAPFYQRVEDTIGVAVAREEVQGPSGKFVRDGFGKLGYEIYPLDRNAPDCCGSGVCVQGCPTNAKRSTQMNYVPMAMNAGAKVYANCRVKSILYKSHHATGVVARFIDPLSRKKGPQIKVNAKVVVVCAGTLHTPALLARSHIPNPSGQRGRNLTMHPATKMYALFDEEVRGWEGIPQGYYCDALVDKGVKFEGIFLAPSFAAGTILLMGEKHREAMNNYKHLACFGFMVSDTTRGRVFRGPKGIPQIWYNINRQDLPKFKMGYKMLAEAFFAAGAKKVFPGIFTLPEVSREDGVGVIERLKLRNKDLDLQAFHPLGTCRMGADPREAVVDGNGRLYGLDNLFVADGSIFPTSLGVNPMVTIMAASSKISDYIHRYCL